MVLRFAADGSLVSARQTPGRVDAVATGADGSIVVAGTFSGAVTLGEGGENATELTSRGGSDVFVAKWDGSGTFQWATQIGSVLAEPSWDQEAVFDVAVHEDGTIALAGRFKTDPDGASSVDRVCVFGEGEPNETLLAAGHHPDVGPARDYFVACYEAGGALRWADRVRTAYAEDLNIGAGVCFLADGSVVLGGGVSLMRESDLSPAPAPGDPRTTALFGEGTTKPVSLVGWQGYVACYESTGDLRWVTGIQEFGGRYVNALDRPGTRGAIVFAGRSSNGMLLGRMTSTGKREWTREVGERRSGAFGTPVSRRGSLSAYDDGAFILSWEHAEFRGWSIFNANGSE